MEYKDRIKAARKHARLTQAELAGRVGIDQTSISDLERGKSASSSHGASIASSCGVSALWLEKGVGEMLPGHGNVKPMIQPHRDAKEYPLISWVAAGMWQESCDNFQPGSADEWLASTVNAGPHGYWLEVEGDSMISTTEYSFVPGTRLLIQPEGFDLISGKFYVAKLLSTGETTFKKYIRDAGIEYLRPLNPIYQTIVVGDGVQIIGRVVDLSAPKSVL